MMGNKKLTEVELFYLDANYGKTSLAAIAHALGRTERFIQKIYNKRHPDTLKQAPLPPPEVKSPVTDKPVETDPSVVKNLMGRRMKDGKPEGITVMTEAASQAADEVRNVNASRHNRFQKCIHTMDKNQ